MMYRFMAISIQVVFCTLTNFMFVFVRYVAIDQTPVTQTVCSFFIGRFTVIDGYVSEVVFSEASE